MTDVVKLIGKGRSGWHAKGVSPWGTFSSSSYDTRDEQMEKYAAQAEDGSLVYDASRVGGELESWVYRGPMCDPTLPPDGFKRFSDDLRHVALRMSPGLGGAFKTFALLAQDEKFSGLDYVGAGLYEALIRAALPGVRVGHVVSGKVVWDEAP